MKHTNWRTALWMTAALLAAGCSEITTDNRHRPVLASKAPDAIHSDVTSGPFVSVGTDGALLYRPYTDRGDTIIDYSYCGYQASEVPIPFIAAVETLRPLPGEATKQGMMAYAFGPDSREQIQAAIDRVAALEPDESGFRGAVFLSKGTYYLNGGLTLKPGVVLRGEGERGFGTILIVQHPGEPAIVMGSDAGKVGDLEPVSRIADEYVPAGSRQLTLENAGMLEVGDTVHVRKTVNQEWIDLIGMDNPGTRKDGRKVKLWKPEAYRINHLRQIAGIEGNTITLDVPLPQSIAQAHGGGEVNAVRLVDIHSLMGVEGLRITGNYDTSVMSELRSEGAPYPADEEASLGTGVLIRNAENVWVRGVRFLHTRWSAVTMKDSRYVTVRDCLSMEPVSEIRGRRRYSFNNSDSSMTLVYNCFAESGRHDFVTGSRDTGPIAFVRGRTEHAKAASETHQRWASGVLFDTISMINGGGLALINRGAAGSGQGWSGANGVIWNSTAPFVHVQNPPSPEQNFAIGCTCTAPEGARFSGVIGDGHIERVGAPVEPESLFEQQLADRIGAEPAYRVLVRTLSKASIPMEIALPRQFIDGVPEPPVTPAQEAFEAADQREWKTIFSDDCTGNWQDQWFLDGEGFTTVTNTPEGMVLDAVDDHMVLWTDQSFQGDVKIEYEFTRVDEDGGGVCIIYIQATGRGDKGYEKDINEWSDYRESPGMGKYFRNMHLYHVSYACGYVRGRRYMPDIMKMNTFTELEPEYVVDDARFFKPGVTYQMTFIKTDRAIRMKAEGDGQVLHFMLNNEKCPPITEGHIGLRQMKTRQSRYKNFRVSVPK